MALVVRDPFHMPGEAVQLQIGQMLSREQEAKLEGHVELLHRCNRIPDSVVAEHHGLPTSGVPKVEASKPYPKTSPADSF